MGPSLDKDAAFSSQVVLSGGFLEGLEFGDAGWNLQIVLSVLSNVVDDEATACPYGVSSMYRPRVKPYNLL